MLCLIFYVQFTVIQITEKIVTKKKPKEKNNCAHYSLEMMAQILFVFTLLLFGKCDHLPSIRNVSIHGILLYVNSHLLVHELACLISSGEYTISWWCPTYMFFSHKFYNSFILYFRSSPFPLEMNNPSLFFLGCCRFTPDFIPQMVSLTLHTQNGSVSMKIFSTIGGGGTKSSNLR